MQFWEWDYFARRESREKKATFVLPYWKKKKKNLQDFSCFILASARQGQDLPSNEKDAYCNIDKSHNITTSIFFNFYDVYLHIFMCVLLLASAGGRAVRRAAVLELFGSGYNYMRTSARPRWGI